MCSKIEPLGHGVLMLAQDLVCEGYSQNNLGDLLYETQAQRHCGIEWYRRNKPKKGPGIPQLNGQ